MANTLRFKRGIASGIPTALAGEPLFTTDTFDLYIGNGTTNTRFQKYIASGATTQILRGDGSLYTFPLAISSPLNGQVLKYNGTSWVNDSDSGITGSGVNQQIAYFTGATTLGGTNNFFWDAATSRLNINTGGSNGSGTVNIRSSAATWVFLKGGSAANQGSAYYITNANNSSALCAFGDASAILGGTPDASVSLYTIASVPLTFNIGGSSERARIFATGNFGIGTGATDSGQRLQVVGSARIGTTAASAMYWDDGTNRLGIATSSPQSKLDIAGSLGSFRVLDSGAEVSFTRDGNNDLFANAGTSAGLSIGGRSYLRFSTGSAGVTEVARFNSSGSLGIGTTSFTGYSLRVAKNITGATTSYGVSSDGVIQSDVTGQAFGFNTSLSTQAAAFTLPILSHYRADQGSLGAGSAITTQYGFQVRSNLIGATNNYGFFGDIASGTGRWNLYMNGTAANYLNGSLLIGSTTDSGEKLQVTGTMKVTGATNIVNTLSVGTTTGADLRINVGVGSGSIASPLNMDLTYLGYAGATRARIRAVDQSNNTTASYLSFWTNNASGTLNENMRLDASGNLGLGVTPNTWFTGNSFRALQSTNGASFSGALLGGEFATIIGNNWFANASGSNAYIANGVATQYTQVSGQHRWFTAASGTANATFSFKELMRLDASGNLGLGVTPSAWYTPATSVLQVRHSSFYSQVDGTNYYTNIGSNFFQDSGTFYKYINSSFATLYTQFNGRHSWSTAPSGTAGNNITFTQAMTLYSTGNLALGSAAGDSGERLQVTGTAKITGATAINAALTITNATLPSFKVNHTAAGHAAGFFDTNEYGVAISSASTSASHYLISMASGSTSRFRVNCDGGVIMSGNLTVDTNTLFVDATNNRVGILTTTPSTTLDVGGNATIGLTSTTGYSLVVQNSGANDTTGIRLTSGGTDNGYFITAYNSVSKYASLQAGDNTAYRNIVLNLLGGNVGIGISPTYKLHVSGTGYFSDNVRFPNLKGIVFVQSGGSLLGSISMDSSDQVTIDNNGFFGLSVGTSYNLLGGNTGIGTSTFGTSATRTFAMLNGTAPSTSPTDIFQMYSNDITAGNAAPHFRTENGAVVKIYQQTSAVGTASWVGGAGSTVTDLDTFDGYTIGQIVKALRNAGFLQ